MTSSKFYYLWLAVDEGGRPVYANLTARRDSWIAQLMLSSTKAKICTTDKGSWYVSAVRKFPVKWVQWRGGFFPIKRRLLSGAGLLLSLPSTPSWRLKVDMAEL